MYTFKLSQLTSPEVTKPDVKPFIVSRLFVSNVKSPSISSVRFVSPRNKLLPTLAFPVVVSDFKVQLPVSSILLNSLLSILSFVGCLF